MATKTYSDTTPTVTYTYDTTATGCFDKGRLSKVQSTASTTNLLCYDALGRVTSSSQVTNGTTYNFPAYTWNLAGSLTSIAYPSGRVVTTTYDKANRPYQVAGTLSSNSTTYASCPSGVSATDPCYASHGALTQLLMGNQQTDRPVTTIGCSLFSCD